MITSGTWDDFTPHGFCLAWDPGLIWLQAGSDLLIALAYYSIPAALLVFLRRRTDLAFRPVFGLFAAFILACGTTHVLGVITLWAPVYWIDGAVKALTAGLSITTALVLWPLLPKALALPSPAALRAVNEALAQQVAEREAAAAALQISEARVRDMFRRAPTALHVTDAHGVILEVSDRWLAMLGYGRGEVLGRPIANFYVDATSLPGDGPLSSVSETLQVATRECVLRRQDGTVCVVQARFDAERDAHGALQRLVVALTDITEQKQTEAALRDSEERLRHAQKMEAVGQLTGGIAHDFNNLLTTIMGSLELLQRRPELDARGQRLTGNALEGARRAAKLTSQLLSFSRRQRLAPESLDLPAVVDGIQDMLARTLGEAARLAVASPQETPWPALADRTQLEMAVLNLVINARDAVAAKGGSGGAVTLSFANRVVTDGTGGQDPLAPGEYVSLCVADTGCGMPQDVMAHVFEPFFTTKRTGSGTGLGLAQTYGFATQSGGTVQIRSSVGVGTEVEILLPRAPRAPGEAAAGGGQAEAPPAMGRGERILLVEDDALLRETASDSLRDQGFTVVTAANGPEALAALRAGGTFDLLFTDVMMPGGMNGVELATAACALQPGLRVTFTTGYSDRKVLAAWGDTLDLIAKPYRLQDVSAHLARLLATVGA